MARPFALRAYQEKMVHEVLSQNAVVVLPTGAGKTAIAAEAIRRLLTAATPDAQKYLFLVPTRMLVKQQAAAVREWCAVEVAEYHGEVALPRESFRILVATPKAFQIAQSKHPTLLGWPLFRHVTFDEVHHVLKDHPYRKIALRIPASVHVLGLTASLSYAVDDAGIRKSIRQLSAELRIQHVATATTQELDAPGYHGNRAAAEVILASDEEHTGDGDKLTGDVDVVDVLGGVSKAPQRTGNQPLPEDARRPHLMAPTFWSRIDSGRCTPFTAALVAAVKRAEACVADEGFASPIAAGAKTRNKMSAWGECVAKLRSKSAKMPREKQAAYWALEQWYEALRLLGISWEENEEGAVMFLKMMFSFPYWSENAVPSLHRLQAEFLARHDVPGTYTRFATLKSALLGKLAQRGRASFRGILFVQQRVMVHILSHYLRQDPETAAMFQCAELYATSSPATPSLAIGKRAAATALQAFATGAVNLLVSTVVAEEGMDVPAANCVFRFDAVLNAVSYLQGRGRARQEDSSFVVLRERADRPAALLHEVEARQLEIAAQFCAESGSAEAANKRRVADETAQRMRERGAHAVLAKYFDSGVESGCAIDAGAAAAALNLYVKKTKADLEEIPGGKDTSSGLFECILQYSSCLRATSGRGAAGDKKGAKRAAAHDLLQRLQIGEGALAA